jgi:DNA recombination protein RmuC
VSALYATIIALAAAAAALAALWLSARRERDAALERGRDEVAKLEGRLAERERRAEELAREIATLEAALASARTALEEGRKSLEERFGVLAGRIVEERSAVFAAQSKEGLGALLEPLRAQLGDFKRKVEDVYDKEAQGRASLVQELHHLKELNQKISAEATNLTRALKGDSKVRGNWGELVVERVLEQSGLVGGREFETQVRLHERGGGARSRYPDVVVRLPEGKDVIVDAKVSLVAYDEYCAAETDEARGAALKRHIDSVRGHVKELAGKSYDDLAGIRSLDLVIMCVPIEPALIAAASNDPGLFDDAFKQRVALVGPSTLLLALKIVASLWRTEAQNRNALDIAERGQLLLDKLVGFIEDLERADKALGVARAALEEAKGKLSVGPGNLVGQAKKLAELGVKAKKQLPRELLEKSEEP